jgi:hypothetical protein
MRPITDAQQAPALTPVKSQHPAGASIPDEKI